MNLGSIAVPVGTQWVGFLEEFEDDRLKGISEFNLLWTCMVLNSETLEEGAVGALGQGGSQLGCGTDEGGGEKAVISSATFL